MRQWGNATMTQWVEPEADRKAIIPSLAGQAIQPYNHLTIQCTILQQNLQYSKVSRGATFPFSNKNSWIVDMLTIKIYNTIHTTVHKGVKTKKSISDDSTCFVFGDTLFKWCYTVLSFYQSRQLLDMTLKHLLNILCSFAVTHTQSVMQRSAPFFSESLNLSPNNSRIVSLFQSSFIILWRGPGCLSNNQTIHF